MAIGAWSSGGSLNTARARLGGAGTQTAGLSFGGTTGAVSAVSEEYNGTAWSAGNSLGAAKQSVGGAGTQSAGLCIAGFTTGVIAACEEYDGTNWSAGGDMGTAKQQVGGGGTQTAAFGAGGNTGSTIDVTEEYNGTSWSVGGSLATARRIGGTCGTLTAGLFAAGFDGSVGLSSSEEYNGTAWSAGGSIATAAYSQGAFGAQDAALLFGNESYGTISEAYNGTAWYVTDPLNTGKSYMSPAGTITAGLNAGGNTTAGALSAVTEEWNYTEIGFGFDANTKSLLHFNGTDTSTTFTDEVGKTWSANGNAQLDTADKRFGTASLLLDGTGDTIQTANNADFNLESGDWTFDFWFKCNTIASYDTFFSTYNSTGTPANEPWYKFDIGVVSGTTAKPRFYSYPGGVAQPNDAGYEMTSAITIADSKWHHIAVQRNSTTVEVLFDGVEQAMTETAAISTNTLQANDGPFVIGDDTNNTPRYFDGWIDEFRYIKGTRKFTADFVPANQEYDNPSGLIVGRRIMMVN